MFDSVVMSSVASENGTVHQEVTAFGLNHIGGNLGNIKDGRKFGKSGRLPLLAETKCMP